VRQLFVNVNFVLLFLGRVITNIGDSMYYVASMWLVYELGGSAFYTGLAGFLILLPKAFQFLFGPFVDRWKIRKTLLTTQILQSILILIIPFTYFLDLLTIQLIFIMMPLIAVIEEFAYPSQTKALPIILKKTELIKGNSAFAFAYQGVDLIFHSVAGILVTSIGAITLFLIDSITFAVAALLFSFLRIEKRTDGITEELKSKNYFSELKEGLSTVFQSLLWVLLLGAAFVNFSIGMTMALLPSIAQSFGGASFYGMLLASMSLGLLVGSLSGSLIGNFPVGYSIIICFTMGAFCWFSTSFVATPFFFLLLFGLAWIPIGAVNVLFAGITQSIIPLEMIGRVNSVMSSFSVIFMPVGSLLGGYIGTIINPNTIFTYTSLGLGVMAFMWVLFSELKKLPRVEEIDGRKLNLNDTPKEAS